MSQPKQPPRLASDGAVEVYSGNENETYTLTVVTNGVSQSVRMSGHNAFRAFGLLGMMLGFKLPPAIGKAIKL